MREKGPVAKSTGRGEPLGLVGPAWVLASQTTCCSPGSLGLGLGLLLRQEPQELLRAEVWGKESASAQHEFHFLPQTQRVLI